MKQLVLIKAPPKGVTDMSSATHLPTLTYGKLTISIMEERQLYEVIRNQVEATTRLIERQEKFLEQVVKVTDDHEKRLRLVERIIGYGSGFAGAVVLVIQMLKHTP